MGSPKAPKSPKINYQAPSFPSNQVRPIIDQAGDELERVTGVFNQRGQNYANQSNSDASMLGVGIPGSNSRGRGGSKGGSQYTYGNVSGAKRFVERGSVGGRKDKFGVTNYKSMNDYTDAGKMFNQFQNIYKGEKGAQSPYGSVQQSLRRAERGGFIDSASKQNFGTQQAQGLYKMLAGNVRSDFGRKQRGGSRPTDPGQNTLTGRTMGQAMSDYTNNFQNTIGRQASEARSYIENYESGLLDSKSFRQTQNQMSDTARTFGNTTDQYRNQAFNTMDRARGQAIQDINRGRDLANIDIRAGTDSARRDINSAQSAARQDMTAAQDSANANLARGLSDATSSISQGRDDANRSVAAGQVFGSNEISQGRNDAAVSLARGAETAVGAINTGVTTASNFQTAGTNNANNFMNTGRTNAETNISAGATTSDTEMNTGDARGAAAAIAGSNRANQLMSSGRQSGRRDTNLGRENAEAEQRSAFRTGTNLVDPTAARAGQDLATGMRRGSTVGINAGTSARGQTQSSFDSGVGNIREGAADAVSTMRTGQRQASDRTQAAGSAAGTRMAAAGTQGTENIRAATSGASSQQRLGYQRGRAATSGATTSASDRSQFAYGAAGRRTGSAATRGAQLSAGATGNALAATQGAANTGFNVTQGAADSGFNRTQGAAGSAGNRTGRAGAQAASRMSGALGGAQGYQDTGYSQASQGIGRSNNRGYGRMGSERDRTSAEATRGFTAGTGLTNAAQGRGYGFGAYGNTQQIRNRLGQRADQGYGRFDSALSSAGGASRQFTGDNAYNMLQNSTFGRAAAAPPTMRMDGALQNELQGLGGFRSAYGGMRSAGRRGNIRGNLDTSFDFGFGGNRTDSAGNYRQMFGQATNAAGRAATFYNTINNTNTFDFNPGARMDYGFTRGRNFEKRSRGTNTQNYYNRFMSGYAPRG